MGQCERNNPDSATDRRQNLEYLPTTEFHGAPTYLQFKVVMSLYTNRQWATFANEELDADWPAIDPYQVMRGHVAPAKRQQDVSQVSVGHRSPI